MRATLFIALLFFASLTHSQTNQNNGNGDDMPAPVNNSSNNQQQNNTTPPPPVNNYNTPPQNNYSNPPDNNYNNQQNNNYNQSPNNYNNQGQNNYYNQSPNNYNQQIDYGAPSYQTFYDELSPYGFWVNYPGYGYVWSPNVGPGFAPYSTNGYWVYTSYGWMWNSGYSWGWAPFHYGRWLRDNMYGWLWVPGHQWAPAHVTWGQYHGYYGWAPLGPGVTVSSGYSPPVEYWNFVPAQNIYQSNVSNYYVNNAAVAHDNISIINASNTYNQNVYYSGPPKEEIERVTGTKITAVQVNEAKQPVAGGGLANNEVNIYRPNISSSTATKAAPAKVMPVENLKTGKQGANTSATEKIYSRPAVPQQPNNEKPLRNAGQPEQREMPSGNRQTAEPTQEKQPAKQGQQSNQQPNKSNMQQQNRNRQNKPANKPKPQQPRNNQAPNQQQGEKR